MIDEKTREGIDELNYRVKIRIAPSPLGGVGVFAMRNLHKGEQLFADEMPRAYKLPYEHFDKLSPEVAELLLERWPLIVGGSAFFYPDARMQAYMNHSDEPNYDNKTDCLLKDVPKGGEILEDYRTINSCAQVFKWLVDKE
jgi:hypothetical protein